MAKSSCGGTFPTLSTSKATDSTAASPRASGSRSLQLLKPTVTAYSDAGLQNGMHYEYQLSLLVAGEDERPSGRPVTATPGPEVAWVADRHSGLVWKISADARSAHFAQGRFFDLAAIALDVAEGSCWVSDRGFAGLYRIEEDGALAALPAAMETPGALAIDAGARIGWLIDAGRQRIFWFSLDAADSLALFPVDATFARPVALAAQAGGLLDRRPSPRSRAVLSGRRHPRR